MINHDLYNATHQYLSPNTTNHSPCNLAAVFVYLLILPLYGRLDSGCLNAERHTRRLSHFSERQIMFRTAACRAHHRDNQVEWKTPRAGRGRAPFPVPVSRCLARSRAAGPAPRDNGVASLRRISVALLPPSIH